MVKVGRPVEENLGIGGPKSVGFELLPATAMSNRVVAIERRFHHRVRLALPIRLRWAGPFGQTIEVSRTRNVSRDGVLVECAGPHPPGASLWVTFPYDPALPEDPSEFPARVAREERDASGRHRLAIAFISPRRSAAGGNGLRKAGEQRSSPRRAVSLPVWVRLAEIPWYEEAMTLDLSFEGMRFLSTRLYEPGNHVYVSLRTGTPPSSWNSGRENLALVVRVDPDPRSNQVAVAVTRLS